jgi:osmotically inducible protein OsmC
MKRVGSAVWHGASQTGKGTVSTESGVLQDSPYSFTTRFEGEKGTNPEELIAAAHAGCFTMAFAFTIAKKRIVADKIQTEATLTIENINGMFTITAIHLDMSASIPDISQADFEEMANDAKKNCVVSRALNPDVKITLSTKLLSGVK